MALVEIRVELPSLLSEMYSLLATDAKKAWTQFSSMVCPDLRALKSKVTGSTSEDDQVLEAEDKIP